MDITTLHLLVKRLQTLAIRFEEEGLNLEAANYHSAAHIVLGIIDEELLKLRS